jgi:hypothetical protein
MTRRRHYGILVKISKGAYQKATGKRRRTNRDRAVIEVYRFQNQKRARPFVGYLKGARITNWTGLRLCDVTKRGGGRSGFPDVTGQRSQRVTFHASCIDGRRYVGTSPGDGMYARLRPAGMPRRRRFPWER